MTAPLSSRRGFITGLVSFIAAPAIVRAGSLMPVKMMIEPYGVGPMMAAIHALSATPCLLDGFDFDAMRADLFRVMAVPPQWIRNR